jgi:hypothetical protein
MTDTLRTAIVYTAYLIDPHAYRTGSMLPRLIVGAAAAQGVLAVSLFIRCVRERALFRGLVLLAAVAVPAGLGWAGTRDASILTSLPVWLFCALQCAVALVWVATRRARCVAHVALFILFALPGPGLLVCAQLVDPAYRTY